MASRSKRGVPSSAALARGVRGGDRALLGQAITLVESDRAEHQQQARELLSLLAAEEAAVVPRVGITGIPGAGKSSVIEALGSQLVAAGRRVAVLAVDPSSPVSGGSILGDKTRMPRLAAAPAAFVRPSPSGGSLGGVTRKTRETIAICEAAGFDVVFVETVGVGQSETAVAEMVDVFVALMLAGTGDELQGIKRGLLELVDVVAINKADGDQRERARRAREEVERALRLLRGEPPPVLACSALEGDGVEQLWQAIDDCFRRRQRDGELQRRRRYQALGWMWATVEQRLLGRFRARPEVSARLVALEAEVSAGRITPVRAAEELLAAEERRDPGC